MGLSRLFCCLITIFFAELSVKGEEAEEAEGGM